jgi:hypothetical protein
MLDFLPNYNITSKVVRGSLTVDKIQNPERTTFRIIIHPGNQPLVEEFFENFIVKPDAVDRVNLRKIPEGGGIITFYTDQIYNSPGTINVPNGSMWRKSEARFWPTPQPLNEFGFLYVALYIAGNYARYFPDKWLLDVEQASPLALAVEELLALVQHRMPALALSELTRVYQVPDD